MLFIYKLFKRILDQYTKLRKRNAFLEGYKNGTHTDLTEFDNAKFFLFYFKRSG